MNADLKETGLQKIQAEHLSKVKITIGITIHGIVVTIVKSMDIALKIALEHILEVTLRDG